MQGQNGLMVTRSSRLKVWNNTFSCNVSGSASACIARPTASIMHNKLDWDVRGYSHGFYNRGQDSAGLLMYEQSSRNIVAYNSITHGGDGVFLWAGQSTMDTGQGGANDNVFFDNDFSHAVANGIEATFSRNTVRRATASRTAGTAIWGGYSFDTVIRDNTFVGNTEGDRDRARPEHHDRRQHVQGRRDGDSVVGERDAGSELGLSEDPRHAQPRLPIAAQHVHRTTRRR